MIFLDTHVYDDGFMSFHMDIIMCNVMNYDSRVMYNFNVVCHDDGLFIYIVLHDNNV